MPNNEMDPEIQELFRYLGIGSGGIDSSKYRIPVEGTIVSRHAPGVTTPTHAQGHFGVDIGAPQGSPVFAIGPGIVTKIYTVENNKKGGNAVITSHEDGQVISYYAHLDTVNVNVGDRVDQNTEIGTVGTSGMIYDGKKRYTAPHLHWQVKVEKSDINPLSIKEKPVGQLAMASRQEKLTKTARMIRLSLLCRLAQEQLGQKTFSMERLKELSNPEHDYLEQTSESWAGNLYNKYSLHNINLYVRSSLRLIGSGQARAVYDLSPDTVLKIAKNDFGIDQNLDEQMNSDLLGLLAAKVIEANSNGYWLVSEKAIPLDPENDSMYEIFGTNLLGHAISNMYFGGFNDKSIKSSISRYMTGASQNQIEKVVKLAKALRHSGIDTSELNRLDQWGRTKDGRIVLIDYGGTNRNISGFGW